jgi:hypothetical protein
VIGHQRATVEDPDTLGRDEHAQRAGDTIVLSRVIVEIEPGLGSLADSHLDALAPIEAVGGQREQAWALLGKDILDRAGRVLGQGRLRASVTHHPATRALRSSDRGTRVPRGVR